jgi:hypothetical protein
MSNVKFKATKHKPHVNPVNYYNQFVNVDDFLKDLRGLDKMGDKAGTLKDSLNCTYKPDSDWEGYYVVDGEPKFSGLADGMTYSKFELLQVIKFGGNFTHTVTYVNSKHLNPDWPYILVGKDVYKVIEKPNKWDIKTLELKPFNIQTIKLLHDKTGVDLTTNKAYDDFVIIPDNVNYEQTVGSCYNLYHPFPHQPLSGDVRSDDIAHTQRFMMHIFGEQYNMGIQYMKILYEQPTQMLPILVLVSKGRQTGKTSFLNYLGLLFGGNYVQIKPEDLINNFNASYATKNVIGVDETVIDKSAAIERIKSLVTSDTILVNQKNVTQYSIPFFGKLIMTSNKETEFMRIDSEEIRFWVRKIEPFGRVDKEFFKKLRDEIPAFLRYLQISPSAEYKSRMVFSAEDLRNDALDLVVKESESGMKKEITLRVMEFFDANDVNSFCANLSEIKQRWFQHDQRASLHYLKKVMEDEMGMEKQPMQRYSPFSESPLTLKPGTPYRFERLAFTDQTHPELHNSNNIMHIDPNEPLPF